MKWFLGIVLSWSITIGVVSSYWGKFALLSHINNDSQITQNKKFAEMSSRYEVMISAYKKMCFIRDTYDKEVAHLMGQVEIHQRNMQKRANSRKILAKALKARNIEYGIGGAEILEETANQTIGNCKKNRGNCSKSVAGIVETPKKQ